MANTKEKTIAPVEELTAAAVASPQEAPPTQADPAHTPEPKRASINDMINQLTIPREKVERPTFIDGMTPGQDIDQIGDEPPEEDESGAEPITDDDEANQEYLNYSDEHKTTATFLIMTIDRAVAFGCGMAAGSSADQWRKFEARSSISEDYLDVTAALVKKYQARMSLEIIFLVTLSAIYAPQVSLAMAEGKKKARAEQATNKAA